MAAWNAVFALIAMLVSLVVVYGVVTVLVDCLPAAWRAKFAAASPLGKSADDAVEWASRQAPFEVAGPVRRPATARRPARGGCAVGLPLKQLM